MSRGGAGWIGVAGLLAAATLGEGGAAPTGLLVWHAVVAGLVLIEVAAGERAHRPSGAPMTALAAFFLVAAAGAVFAPYGYAAWLFLLDLAAFVGVVWIAARRGPELLGRLVLPLLFVAAAQSVLLLIQRFALDAPRPAGTLLNPNHFAAWAVAVLLLAWGDASAWAVRSRPGPVLRGALSLPVLAAVALIGSRGALLGLLAGLGVTLASRWRGWPARRRRVAGVLAVLVVALAAAGLATRLRQADPFRYQRLRIWEASVGMVAQAPWLGTGPRQFAHAARNHQFADGDGPLQFDRGFRTTHSDWLRVACELGLVGAAALALVLATLLREARRSDREPVSTAAAAVAALVALVAQAAVENLSARPAVYLLAAALLGALLARRRGPATPGSPLLARAAAAAAVVLVFLVGDVAPYLAWREARGLPDGALDAAQQRRLERALARNGLQPDYSRRQAEALAADRSSWTVEGYARAREAAERAVRLNPAGAENHVALARVEAQACKSLFPDRDTRRRAEAAYDRAAGLDRFNPLLPLERAGFLLDTGDAAGARVAARRAVELEPRSVLPRLVLAAAELEAGGAAGPGRARELLEEARGLADAGRPWAASSAYARELLGLDPSAVARLEHALATAPSERGQGPGTLQ